MKQLILFFKQLLSKETAIVS